MLGNTTTAKAAKQRGSLTGRLRYSHSLMKKRKPGVLKIRFWHRNTATESAILKLELVELRHHVTRKPVRELWLSSTATSSSSSATGSDVKQAISRAKQSHTSLVDKRRQEKRADGSPSQDFDHEEWARAVVDLNNVAVNFSYILQFKVSSADLKTRGEIAVRNISMSRSCFYGVLSFESCGRTGSFGPTQEDCDKFYGQRELVIVRERQNDPLKGAQSWTVPETMTYRVQALGSRGGEGVYPSTDMRKTRGASVTAKFAFTKGDHLLFLVGQLGESACKIGRGPDNLLPSFCPSSRSAIPVKGGGGGGGGATVVYRISGNTTTVMMVAGGGGGLPFLSPDLTWLNVESSTVPYDLSTEGFSTLMAKVEADSFLIGPMEGRGPCSLSIHNNVSWAARGGFGRGGGACISGGHGGGADLNVDSSDLEIPEVGRPGRSYTHASALYSAVTPDIHTGSGFVEIMSVTDCACDFRCVWLGQEVDTPSCICPYGKRLDQDNFSCLEIPVEVGGNNNGQLLIPLIIGACLVVLLVFILVCLYKKRSALHSRRSASSMEKIGTFLCPCLKFPRRPMGLSAHILPQLQQPPTVMRVNPNYDIVDTKPAEQGLIEIPRKNIKLTGELGQGAFGEVYSGLLSNVPMVDGDLPVAVKTLPPVCTEQTESDFHMEAVIVSQFNHPNIVKFIGVCFSHHPHYIVLELLEGGDLKTFLRAARPKQDQPSSLTVLDLLRLSLDVARGCQHLEEKRFIHRDIAARNCLLTTKGPNRTAKIADFGMARDIYRSDYYKKAGRAMLPVKWMPPEAFLDGVFTTKTDVWSFGILLWEVFSLGHMPYPGCSNEEVMTLVTQGGRLDPPDSCSLAVLSIMIACWSSVPEERPTFSAIISSLEKSLQSSRGLPVIYAPPTISAGGFRLHSGRPSPNSPFLGPGTVLGSDLTSSCGESLGRLPVTGGDGYLAPLLRSQQQPQVHQQQNSRPISGGSTAQRSGFPHNHRAKSRGRPSQSLFSTPSTTDSLFQTSSQTSGGSYNTGTGGSVFLDCVGGSGTSPQPSKNRAFKTARVFYKPGAATNSGDNRDAGSDPASQALLHDKSQDDNCCPHCSSTQTKASSPCEHCQQAEDDGEEENLKQGLPTGAASVALPPLERAQSKKVCYTHLPRPSV
ncbi:hypothetical protein PoB_000885500 [Plakobranchus ocellatus]|uniref:Protein kinase domain-containing protein n=1 Tax=Plakobranchus ocellatus TaxID=259542 RepID=A0AAV3YHY1_9GAST|nr:hypothetical protein PoB_000885500 [Plakobranchus ocellatus]